MSRIHEALKKAEQERTLGGNVATTPEDPRLEAVTVAANKPRRKKEELSPESLRFENLIKRCSKANWKSEPNTNLFMTSENGLDGSERFRTLRSRLYQIRSTRKLRSLLVTSAVPGEGKTFIANNLASILDRQPSTKVLLIDADMRCPQLHLAMGAPNSPGVTDYLREEAGLEDVLQHGNQGNLCFIPAGNVVANPGELVAGPGMKELLDLICPTFDWVIIDSPPVLPVSDALVLADMVDGVLQVVAAASTNCEDAQKACREFQHKNLLGIVLNRGEEGRRYGYYSGY